MTDPTDVSTRHPLGRRITDVLTLQPDTRAIEHDGVWSTWGELAVLSGRISELVDTHSGGEQRRVGVLLRNTPAHVATMLGILMAGGSVAVINPSRGDDRTRADIAGLKLPLIIGTDDDVTKLVAPAPESTVVAISDLTTPPVVREAGQIRSSHNHAASDVAVHMLTSGTTGPPKRVDITYNMLARSVMGPDRTWASSPTELRNGVAIVNAPLVHIGGIFRVLQCVSEGRSFVLLPRFDLDRWADAVRAYRPRAVSLVPTALRMVLHSDLTGDDLQSIRAVTSGTAPLSVEDAEAFTAKFGIPVLTSYAATEFGGGVAGWSLADHQQFWASKRGSVGRATGGAQLRVVDAHGNPLGPDESGVLEVKPGQMGTSAPWLRTTDIGRIDPDGFVWILGRADQAIIRGGFKVMPDDVRVALERHPAIAGAAVVGKADQRLGQTPVAMVELRPDGSTDPDELTTYLQKILARYEIPTEIAVVGEIPRTPSGKADLGAVRRHFDTGGARV
ncbi:class I adenylate-forming enzyme family protein [Nocardia sp. 348MFTsu5.1]|uniref:class I adenylate-forming enzyme family protein n=1 Tax=Nocardia sp. 348MFTsu5.1 TaxID=1172185 RepID=UPI0003642C58|nr:AMP-binding protein [Nocardia sp. 348MFTsu5.1]